MFLFEFLKKIFSKKEEEIFMCRAIYHEYANDNVSLTFDSQKVVGTDLESIIKDDKRYGVMKPKNGKYFTYKVMDWEGKWITNEKIIKGITLAWNKVEKIVQLDFREAKEGEYADFKVYFRKTIDDPNLSKSTLMYHYYPINDYSNEKRGVCVVNADYAWTSSGEPIPLNEFDPENYPNPTTATAKTFDFDATYEHEGPGHGLGLPHSPNRMTKMFFNYDGMAESIFDENPPETISRLRAKYEKKEMSDHELNRWKTWFKVAQDRE